MFDAALRIKCAVSVHRRPKILQVLPGSGTRTIASVGDSVVSGWISVLNTQGYVP